MKKLEELGISPAPWYVDADKMMLDSNGHYIQLNGNYFEGEYDRAVADQNIMVAAPLMYEALRMYHEAFEEIRKSAWFIDANFHEIMQLNKIMNAAEAALAKASGESEVNQ